MRKKHRSKIFLTLLALGGCILLAICWFLISPAETKFSSYSISTVEHFSYNWLNKLPCQAPCWEGIIPENTSADKAVQLLQENPLFSDVKRFKDGRIIWSWSNDAVRQGGEIFYYLNGAELIYSIRPNYERSFKLKDVIQAYGEPSFISAYKFTNSDAPPSFNLRLYFIEQGILIKSYQPTNLNFALTPDLMVFAPEFSFEYTNIVPTIKTILPWQGFKNFGFYCRDRINNIPCQP